MAVVRSGFVTSSPVAKENQTAVVVAIASIILQHDANRVVRVLRKIGFELTDGWVESDPANKNPFSQETTNNNPRPADEPPILKDMEAWQIMQRLDNGKQKPSKTNGG